MPATPKRDLMRAAYRTRRKAKQCVRCGAPALPGLTQCETHRQAQGAYMRARYRLMAEALKRSRG